MRLIALIVGTAVALMAQDAPQFDLMTHGPMSAWQFGIQYTLLIILGYALLYGMLVGTRKLLIPRRTTIPWKKLRFAVPSGGTIVLGAAYLVRSEPLAFFAAVVNLPAFLLGLPIALLFIEASDAFHQFAIYPLTWLAWYVIMRLVEAPTWRRKPLSLNLADKAQ